MGQPMGALIRPLSADQIVQIWELGYAQHPLDRALICLAGGCPDLSMGAIAILPIGQRDAALLTLRELTFGARLDSQATCPHCRELLEFSLNVADIRVIDLDQTPVEATPSVHHLHTEGLQLTFRLPNSLDLAAIAPLSGDDARIQLAQRCLLQIEQEDQPLPPETLSEGAIAHLSQHFAEADPQAEVWLDLHCPACGHDWRVLFDIASFFWSELQVQAQRLLQEVHLLARAYGWREADILALSAARRRYYLELVS
ncbi:MAG: hypothetical protein VKK04_23880 [Synechococcales bacterium]|nr:hypothetical protein [Synechococcales bacterium]